MYYGWAKVSKLHYYSKPKKAPHSTIQSFVSTICSIADKKKGGMGFEPTSQMTSMLLHWHSANLALAFRLQSHEAACLSSGTKCTYVACCKNLYSYSDEYKFLQEVNFTSFTNQHMYVKAKMQKFPHASYTAAG